MDFVGGACLTYLERAAGASATNDVLKDSQEDCQQLENGRFSRAIQAQTDVATASHCPLAHNIAQNIKQTQYPRKDSIARKNSK